MDPVGAEVEFAFFDEVGDQGYDGGDFSAAKLGDLLEGVAFFEEVQGFLRRAGWFGVPFLGGAFAGGEAAEGVENFGAVDFALFFAHAGDLAEFGDGAGLNLADGVECGVVQDDEGGGHFLAGGVSAPLAEEFAQLFVHLHGGIEFKTLGFEGAVGIFADLRGLRGTGERGGARGHAGEPFGHAGADVADFAAVPFGGFAEVGADALLAAFFGADELLHLVVALPGTVFFLGVADAVDEEGAQGIVFLLPEEVAIGGQAIASGAAGFLIELLDAVRQAEAHDGPDIWFVDAEAEGDGADEDAGLFGHPLFLIFAAGAAVHLAMVADGGDAALFEEINDFADTRDGGGVDDDVAVLHFFYRFHDVVVLHAAFALADNVTEIFAAEAGDGFEGIAEFELGDDVVADLLGGAGGEGGDGLIGEKGAEFAELAIFGAEVVAPLRDAMGFINSEEGDGDFFEPFGGAVHDGALGGDVHQTILAGDGLLFDVAAVGFDDGAVEEDSGDAPLAKLRDLVLHQGDEGRDDHGGAAFVEYGGKLVAEGFAAAGGHDDADVAAGGECA